MPNVIRGFLGVHSWPCFYFLLLLLLFEPDQSLGQGSIDLTKIPKIDQPVYAYGKGPLILMDRGHNNHHTREGRYAPFAYFLEQDGYRIKDYDGPFIRRKLKNARILVISNALHESNVGNWSLPTPSAFSRREIRVLKKWIRKGGSLFLLADHMLFAGASSALAAGLGFDFSNGYVIDTLHPGPTHFSFQEKNLVSSIITNGRDAGECVEEVVSLTGQGFKMDVEATAIMVFDESYVNMMPDTAWVFDHHVRKENARGLIQGAYKKYHKGRIVVFGEAAMFTVQTHPSTGVTLGMNAGSGPDNARLLLNIMHWLDRTLD